MVSKKRKDGRIRRSFTDKTTGKRIYFYGFTEREVNKKIMEYESKKESGNTFSEVAAEWWSLEVTNLSPSTVRGYENATRRVCDFFGTAFIKDINTADITRFLHKLKQLDFAKKTIKNHKIIINRIFHFAVVMGYVPHNPAREAELPRGLKETKRHPASPKEEALIRENSSDIWLLPLMALLTGMRKGELLGLKWKDIDLDKNLITVERSVWYEYGGSRGARIKEPKTEAGKRKIPIVTLLKTELEKHKNKNPEHFVFGDSRPLTEKAYTYQYNKFKKETGITATAQQLRKSYATLAVSANVPPDVLKAIFGHADISTTLNIYAEVREDRIHAAGKLLDAF